LLNKFVGSDKKISLEPSLDAIAKVLSGVLKLKK